MAHALAARATSLSAAFGLLGVMVLAALTATLHIAAPPPDSAPGTIIMTTPAPPPTPPTSSPAPQHEAPFEHATFEPFRTIPTIADPPSDGGGEALGPPQLPLISRPAWARVPHDLDRFYPRGALRQNVEGRAVLDCVVSTIGALACTVASETPAGWGFGGAALNIAAEYRMIPATRDGAPVEGRYRMVVPFDLR